MTATQPPTETTLLARGHSPAPSLDRLDDESPAPAIPAKPEKTTKSRKWVPRSLSTPVLLSVMALTLLLFATIEILAQRSKAKNGLARSSSVDEIPQYAILSYRYLPTLVAVLFSLIWNWIDLDVKRMQPWIELSRPTGATAENSILLDYPSDYFLVAPFRAAKRRHWGVLVSGSVMAFIFTVLTPLQSALFGISTTIHSETTTITARSELMPAGDEPQRLGFLHRAYAIGWLNATYPPFATSDYVLQPFYTNKSTSKSPGMNWTAATTRFWAETTCYPVDIKRNTSLTKSGYVSYQLSGLSGKNHCFDDLTLDPNTTSISIEYTDNRVVPGHGSTATDQIYLNCSRESYAAQIYWANRINSSANESPEFSITAMQCEVEYLKQNVLATVTSQSQAPIDDTIKPLSEPVSLSSEEFDRDAFLELLPQYRYVDSRPSDNQDFVDVQSSALLEAVEYPNVSSRSYMVTYMFSGYNDTFQSLSSSSKLEGLVENVHKSLFSLFLSDRFIDGAPLVNNTLTSTFYQTGIVVSRAYALVLEVLLILISLAIGFIIYFIRFSPCNLTAASSSISEVIQLAHNSSEAVHLFWDMDVADDKALANKAQRFRFRLAINHGTSQNELLVTEEGVMPADTVQSIPSRSYYSPVKPFALRRATGMGLIAALLAGIIVLSYFKQKEQSLGGLPLPSKNFEVLQLLENYIPTIFATLVEPFWIFLTRTMCIFQPFQDLWAGHSPAAKSIQSSYTSLPPHMIFFKAIGARHIMLATLSLITLLANALAVSLGAVFIEGPTGVNHRQSFGPIYDTRFNRSFLESTDFSNVVQDGFLFMTWSNMSFNSRLNPWTSPEYFFQPHKIVGELDTSNVQDTYLLRTIGFGADANCKPVAASSSLLKKGSDDEKKREADSLTCDDQTESMLTTFIEDGIGDPVSGPASGVNSNAQLEDGRCVSPLTIGWARAPNGLKENSTNITTSYLVCRPTLKTAMFEVSIDREGYVLEYDRVGKDQAAVNYANLTSDSKLVLHNLNRHFPVKTDWKNGTGLSDWISQFIFFETGSRDFVDPKLPLPDPTKLIPAVSRLYSRAFAIFLEANNGILETPAEAKLVEGARVNQETRIFMDNTAFIFSMTVLGLDVVLAVVFYLRATPYVLPRSPTTIGSLLAYIAPSRAVENGKPLHGWGSQTFSFGRYLGHDGKGHIGVEMDPYVASRDSTLRPQHSSLNPLLGNFPSKHTVRT